MAEITNCLPIELRGAAITPISVGLSGAGVYRVALAGQAYVLKISASSASFALQQRAADAGLAPCIVHVDRERCATLSEFVVDRGFAAWYFPPPTRDAAIAELGTLLRGVHALPLAPDAVATAPRTYLATTWEQLVPRALPSFARAAIATVLAEPAPEHPLVASHNDVNPSNLVYDGTRVMLLDWDASGPGDPLFDLATAAVFLRMTTADCLALLAAHDGHPSDALPPRFDANRRLVAAMCGAIFLKLATDGGHPGGDTDVTTALDLGDVYQRMRAGALDPRTVDGQWAFGLALLKTIAL